MKSALRHDFKMVSMSRAIIFGLGTSESSHFFWCKKRCSLSNGYFSFATIGCGSWIFTGK